MWLIACATVRETSGWKTFPYCKDYIKIWTSILRTTQDWHTSASNIRQNIVESCVILKNLISYFENFLKFNCLYANSENVTHFYNKYFVTYLRPIFNSGGKLEIQKPMLLVWKAHREIWLQIFPHFKIQY